VALTPEEWVRQHFLQYLVHDRLCPATLIGVEQALTLNGLAKRADIVVHGPSGAPVALVECKAPGVPITQDVFDQAARYNMVFKVGLLIVTNGRDHYACRIDHASGTVSFLDHVPAYDAMVAASAR
jgi:type I site-specific restriction endonuclease